MMASKLKTNSDWEFRERWTGKIQFVQEKLLRLDEVTWFGAGHGIETPFDHVMVVRRLSEKYVEARNALLREIEIAAFDSDENTFNDGPELDYNEDEYKVIEERNETEKES